MSYLILPILRETFLFSEAIKVHKQILKFHYCGKRDTADQTARAFKFHNFMKVIELQSFVDKCQRSCALLTARSEVPLLSMVCQPDIQTAESAKAYLLGWMAGFLERSEYLPGFDGLAIPAQGLSDNGDYELLVSFDACGKDSVDTKQISADQKRLDYQHSITNNVALLEFLIAASNTAPEADSFVLDQKIEALTKTLDVVRDHKFGPRFACPERDFEAKCWAAVLAVGRASLQDGGKSTELALEALTMVKSLLGFDSNAVGRLAGTSGASPSPQWITRLAFFARSVASFCPLLLSWGCSLYPGLLEPEGGAGGSNGGSKGKKGKKDAKKAAAGVPDLRSMASNHISQMARALDASLKSAIDVSKNLALAIRLPGDSCEACYGELVESWPAESNSSPCDSDMSAALKKVQGNRKSAEEIIQAARSGTTTKIAASHAESFDVAVEILSYKRAMLKRIK
jgi:hypothetical protein